MPNDSSHISSHSSISHFGTLIICVSGWDSMCELIDQWINWSRQEPFWYNRMEPKNGYLHVNVVFSCSSRSAYKSMHKHICMYIQICCTLVHPIHFKKFRSFSVDFLLPFLKTQTTFIVNCQVFSYFEKHGLTLL